MRCSDRDAKIGEGLVVAPERNQGQPAGVEGFSFAPSVVRHARGFDGLPGESNCVVVARLDPRDFSEKTKCEDPPSVSRPQIAQQTLELAGRAVVLPPVNKIFGVSEACLDGSLPKDFTGGDQETDDEVCP